MASRVGGNKGNIMLQAQRMQSQIKQLQDALEEETYEGAAGGGLVKVVVELAKTMGTRTATPPPDPALRTVGATVEKIWRIDCRVRVESFRGYILSYPARSPYILSHACL